MSETDLWGDPVAIAKRGRKASGYARPPGSGPKGSFCKTCRHFCRIRYHAKTYFKCGLLAKVWTHGPGTDILAGSPGCEKWDADPTQRTSVKQ